MTRTLTEIEVVEQLKARQGDRSLRRFAEDLGISVAYLSDIYRGNRAPGEKVLEQLGLEKEVSTQTVYRSKDGSNAAD